MEDKTLKMAIIDSQLKAAYSYKWGKRYIISAYMAPYVYAGYVQTKSKETKNWSTVFYTKRDNFREMSSLLNKKGKPWSNRKIWKPVPNNEEWKEILEIDA